MLIIPKHFFRTRKEMLQISAGLFWSYKKNKQKKKHFIEIDYCLGSSINITLYKQYSRRTK